MYVHKNIYILKEKSRKHQELTRSIIRILGRVGTAHLAWLAKLKTPVQLLFVVSFAKPPRLNLT